MNTNLYPQFEFDRTAAPLLIGIDEVGRGALAGPVLVGAVALPLWDATTDQILDDVTDSKKLNAKQREALFEKMAQMKDVFWAIGCADADTVDTIGINAAITKAAVFAIEACARTAGYPDLNVYVLADYGIKVPFAGRSFKKGDQHSASIGAASIMAKVVRDRYMASLEDPGYGFAQHAGYGTVAHYAAIERLGLSKWHRRTFIKEKSA